MSLTPLQFTTLSHGAFGATLDELGFTLDTSGPEPVARKGDKVLSLLVVEGRAMQWQVNGAALTPFRLNGRDEKSMNEKAAARAKLEQIS